MPYYEVLCLASGKLGRKELGSLLHKTCRAFIDNGATVTRISPLGATGNGPRDLAYRIRINQVSHHKGFFVNVCAFASPKALAEVERQLKVDERMLRHIAIRKPTTDAVKPIPDIDQPPRVKTGVSKNDPEHALRQFLVEHERDLAVKEYEQTRKNVREALADGEHTAALRGGENGKMNEVVASLKAWSEAEKPNSDPSLNWLSDLKRNPTGSS
ncbi:30S ribosomal protein S6 [Gracilariopsis chorda]|uniref:30S ribosomal protein S6, chloroplastic n=1 Tax=Gracilariopsis chorda TaxID=448386 RepID=A0A2V3J3S1_9FLOR|nr:30S ribosomal protein S6 [Gracilariopsis chorda]|eukprot:PXF49058.1 30S ribosomal protein S6 [Gracilariopsis chorda]